MFVQRVKEKEAELKEAEKEVRLFHLYLAPSGDIVYTTKLLPRFLFLSCLTQNSCSLSLQRSCMRSLTVWRSSTRTRKRNWRKRRRPWMTSSTRSNRKRLQQSSCRTKPSRQGAPPHSRGTKRGKSKYCSLPPVSLFLYHSCRRPLLVVSGLEKWACYKTWQNKAILHRNFRILIIC